MARGKKAKAAEKAVGIDVSAKTLHVAIRGLKELLEFENTAKGHKKLGRVLTKRGQSARVVVESTGTYHLDLALFLDSLKDCQVMVANPRTTKAFHSAQSQRAKTDSVDARSLAEFAFRMPFTAWVRPSKEALQLRSVARYRNQLVVQKTRLTNQLHAVEATDSTDAWIIEEQRSQIQDVERRIKRAEAEMERQAKGQPELWTQVERFMTVPGVGLNTAIQVASEFMLLDRTMTSKEITAWAGLDPKPRQSGTSVRGNNAISKRGSSRMRLMLFMPALVAVRGDTPFRALHRRITERTGTKMKGVIAVMRKLLTVLWSMYRNESAYDPDKASPRREFVHAT